MQAQEATLAAAEPLKVYEQECKEEPWFPSMDERAPLCRRKAGSAALRPEPQAAALPFLRKCPLLPTLALLKGKEARIR